MSAQINQDFITYVGDAVSPIYTVLSPAGSPVDISTATAITWTAKRNNASVAVITKTLGAGIVLIGGGTGGQFQVNLLSADTANLSGFYIYTTAVIDASGNPTTVATGRMRVALEPVWTYDATQLLTTPLYQVRRLIGDVITTDQQLGDAEILFALANRPSIYGAGADCCRDIAAQYSRKVDVITAGAGGSLKTNYSAQSKAYLDMAIRLDTMAITRSGTVPYAGGISIADKQVNEQDTDRVAPQFNIGMEDNQIFGGPIGNELADASSEDDPGND